MAQPLNEWASGKAGMVSDRVYSLLTKYTGVKFKVCPTFHSYKNKWGIFFGKFALASNGRYYRLNFSRTTSDEIVSMDVWGKGKDALETLPAYTCSFEGFGISKIILFLKDFILSPENNLTEQIMSGKDNLDEDAAFKHILYEDSNELKIFITAFLSQDPGWQKNWSTGAVDPNQYFKSIAPWIKSNQVNGAKYSGNPTLTTIMVMSNTKTLIKQNPSVLGANAGGAAKAIQIVPSVAVVKGTTAGAETPIDLTDAYDEKITFTQIQTAMLNNKKGPLAQMAAMKESICDLFEMGDYGETMAVIWGRGGIGKTRTLKDTMEELGLSQGEHYLFIAKSINSSREGSIQKWIIDNAKKEFLIINDNDEIFKPTFMNTWKQVLEHDPKWGRHLQVEYPPGRRKEADEPEAGDYEIKCKFVWLSNFNPDQWLNDPSGAMKSRYISVEYNFTDEEVMAIIADNLEGLYPEFNDTVTIDDKARIFNCFWKAALKRKTQGQERTQWVSFRAFNDTIERWWFFKSKGISFDTFVQKYLNAKLNATRA
jgi:hypothetical protein